MDPLSIIASTIAIATPLTIGLQKVRAAKNARGALLLLSNDISEVIILLRGLEQELRTSHLGTGEIHADAVLLQTLDATRNKLAQLQVQTVKWLSNDQGGSSSRPKIIRWASIARQVSTFKDDLGRIRSQLLTTLSAANL